MIWLQNILIILLAGYMTIDQNGPVVLSWFSAIVGMISGLIMGDVSTGLMIGGTFQLMSLGVAALGGASAPNYGLATIIGTFIAVRTGTGIDAAIAVGLPVVGIAMLMRYMPVKKFLPFILIGFVLSAYLNVPVLGIAIVGFAAAFGYFKIQLEKAEAQRQFQNSDAVEHRKNAGFTDGEPWIAVNDNYKTINAEAAVKDPKSVFFYYKKLVQLRHEVPVITDGVYKLLDADNEKVYTYLRLRKMRMRHYW